MKLTLLMYDRILRSPPNSLLFEAYRALSNVSIKFPLQKLFGVYSYVILYQIWGIVMFMKMIVPFFLSVH